MIIFNFVHSKKDKLYFFYIFFAIFFSKKDKLYFFSIFFAIFFSKKDKLYFFAIFFYKKDKLYFFDIFFSKKDNIMTKFYYKVLGLPENASDDQIKKQYKKLALEWHPDRNLENPTRAQEMFNIISEAYQTLGSRKRRLEYHRNLKYKPSKLYSANDLFNYLFDDTSSNAINNQSHSIIPWNTNQIFSKMLNDNFFKTSSYNGYMHQSSSIIKNGIEETKSTNEYYKNGKKYVEEKHTFIDKDGKRKTKTRKYSKPLTGDRHAKHTKKYILK